MNENVRRALGLIGASGSLSLSDLKYKYNERYGNFDSKIIGELCQGESPFCKLRGTSLQITKDGRKALGETPEPEPEKEKPKKPKPKAKTVKTRFVETDKEVAKVVYAIDEGKNTLLTGPTGCGKSFLIEELADHFTKKLWTVNCDVELDKTELVGHYEVVANDGASETIWVEGILPTAMKNGDWIVLDEVNMARPEVISVLHSALDHRRTLTIKEHGNEEIVAHKDFRVFATMNPDYSGTAELNYAFRRRFETIVEMKYLPETEERLLIEKMTGVSHSVADKCVLMANDTRELAKKGKINYPVSTAHLIEFAFLLKKNIFSPLECAKISLNVSDDPDEVQDVLNCVKSYF